MGRVEDAVAGRARLFMLRCASGEQIIPGRAPQFNSAANGGQIGTPSMKRLLIGAVILTAACGSSSEPTVILSGSPSPSASVSPTPPAHASVSPTHPAVRRNTPATRSAPPNPTPAKEPSRREPMATVLPERLQEYMLRLESIHPALSSDEGLAITRGQAVCEQVAIGAEYPYLITYTKKQFSTANDPITSETASSVYEVVRDAICPK